MEGTSNYTGLGSLVGTLLGLTAILLVAYFLVWYLSRRGTIGGGSRYIKIMDRVPLGGEKQLLLVKAGEKILLVGVTSKQTEVLSDLSTDSVLSGEQTSAPAGGAFAGILEKKLWNLGSVLRKERDGDA